MTTTIESTEPSTGSRRRSLAPWAFAGAVLLHALLFALVALVPNWVPAPTPPPIPVNLVYVPPPAPKPPPPAPQPKPQPQPQAPPQPERIVPRESGDEEKTEARKEERPVEALPAPTPPTPTPVPAAKPRPAAPPERPSPTAIEDPKPADRRAALVVAPPKPPPLDDMFHTIRLPSAKGGSAERDTSGDAYLNELTRRIDRNRVYPPASSFGGQPERVVVFNIVIDPRGNLTATNLVQSTGSDRLDEAAGQMIRNSTPFPPLPASYPQVRALVTVVIPLRPNP